MPARKLQSHLDVDLDLRVKLRTQKQKSLTCSHMVATEAWRNEMQDAARKGINQQFDKHRKTSHTSLQGRTYCIQGRQDVI